MPRAGALVVAADTAAGFAALVAAVGAFCARETEMKTVSALIAPMSFKCALLMLASLGRQRTPDSATFFGRVARLNHIPDLRRARFRRFQPRERIRQLVRREPILLRESLARFDRPIFVANANDHSTERLQQFVARLWHRAIINHHK